MKELPKKYDSKETESRWQKAWLNTGVYHWDESQPRENTYVIDTPPPTVSGHLHMGHIFSYTQADFMARYQRMSGKTVFYPMGFDDNGLPTERLVEKTIKKRAVDLGREAFIEECDKVAEEAREVFRELFQSVALSVDWNQEYHTISEDCRKISQMSFLDLFHKDRAYRKLQPMLWDPVDQTAIAQAEVEDKELSSTFNDITFGIEGSNETFVIGTTRPELIPACVAIFFHPDDARYKHLLGKNAISPLFGVPVPIMTDDTVDMEKGTGIMMCCTFGDEADIEKWRKHDLPARMVLNNYAKMELKGKDWLEGAPEELIEELHNKRAHHQDKNVPNARSIILQKLEEAGALVKSEAITHAVPCAERSGSPLEIMPTHQWFIKILDQKAELKAKIDECVWHPEYMKVRAHQWVDGLSWDWCVSRQRYFGVPFPVWYARPMGRDDLPWTTITAKADELPINPLSDIPKCFARAGGTWQVAGEDQFTIVIPKEDIKDDAGNVIFEAGSPQPIELRPEMDVMDTWATSSVSPQLNSKAISDDYEIDLNRHNKLFPADLRPQAHEIIRTWAFYTIAKSHLHENTVPWKNLMISGWCLAEDKTKMSKSKGNVVTPIDLIEEFGADTVRYWASTSRLGSDTAYSKDVMKIGRKLVTKLWNASKFAAIQLQHLQGTPTTATQDVENGTITQTLDKWLLTRLHKAIAAATEQFEKYEYCAAREKIEDFFWNDFCDNYLEMVKKRAYNEDGSDVAGQQSAVYTIYHALEAVLRLFAPFVPHITEELYSHIFDTDASENNASSIHRSGAWPKSVDYPVDNSGEEAGIACRQILDIIRRTKGDAGVSIKWPIEKLYIKPAAENPVNISSCTDDLCAVSNSREIAFEDHSTMHTSENQQWQVGVELAAESDAA